MQNKDTTHVVVNDTTSRIRGMLVCVFPKKIEDDRREGETWMDMWKRQEPARKQSSDDAVDLHEAIMQMEAREKYYKDMNELHLDEILGLRQANTELQKKLIIVSA